MSNSQNSPNQLDSIFSKLELDCNLEKKIKKLEEEKNILELKLQELEKKELERTKNNPDIQTVVLYLHSDGAFMLCEKWQENQFSSYTNCACRPDWGNGLKFDSIAGLYTQLMRLGFKFYHESKHYHHQYAPLPTEVWVKNL